MRRFVFESNLKLFIGRLEETSDEDERGNLFRLLVLEIDRFAREEDCKPILARYIAEGDRRIHEQRELLDRLTREIHRVELLLTTSIEARDLLIGASNFKAGRTEQPQLTDASADSYWIAHLRT